MRYSHDAHMIMLSAAEMILDDVLEACTLDMVDSSALQKAVECQVSVNRIVFLLNRKQEEEDETI